ncbi:unnamed protein product, partial [marine sediment metagenome]
KRIMEAESKLMKTIARVGEDGYDGNDEPEPGNEKK